MPKIVIDVADDGQLTLGSDVQLPLPLMHWYLTVARKVLVDSLDAKPAPLVKPVSGAHLSRLPGMPPMNGAQPS